MAIDVTKLHTKFHVDSVSLTMFFNLICKIESDIRTPLWQDYIVFYFVSHPFILRYPWLKVARMF